MRANTIIKKAAVVAKETAKLATSVAVGYCVTNGVLKQIKRPNDTQKLIATSTGVITGSTTYRVLDKIEAGIREIDYI